MNQTKGDSGYSDGANTSVTNNDAPTQADKIRTGANAENGTGSGGNSKNDAAYNDGANTARTNNSVPTQPGAGPGERK
jgi:hypothetical protein